MIIASRPLWLAQTNCYVLAAESGGPAVLIDAPPEPDALTEMVREHNVIPAALLLSHGHIDHMGGAGPVNSSTGPRCTSIETTTSSRSTRGGSFDHCSEWRQQVTTNHPRSWSRSSTR